MFGLRPNKAVEAPPDQYTSGPTQTGATTEHQMTLDQVGVLCRAFGIGYGAPTSAGKPYEMGCYIPQVDWVVLPTKDEWPSSAEWNALREHEWAHARGWMHNPDGHGTSPNSLPPKSVLGSASGR